MKWLVQTLVGIASGLPVAAVPVRTEVRPLPLPPTAFTVELTRVPGFAQARIERQATTSPSKWVGDLTRVGLAEVRRLRVEGFREGVQEELTSRTGLAASSVVLLGSGGAAKHEVSIEIQHQEKELGPGSTRFSVSTLSGAAGIRQTEPARAGYPGLYPVVVVFSVGHCSAGIGFTLNEQATAQRDAVVMADRLQRHLERACG